MPEFRTFRQDFPLKNILVMSISIPLIVIGFSPYPLVTFLALLLLGLWVLYESPRTEFWVSLFILAGIFGTLGEYYCVYGEWTSSGQGLWEYHFPEVWGLELPPWIPLVWGNLFVLFAGIASQLTPTYDKELRNPTRSILKFLGGLIVLVYAGYLYRTIMPGILYMLTPFLALFLIFWTHIRDFTIYFVAAFLGTIGEILAMRWELWSYSVPMLQNEFIEFLEIPGLPISLAMAWGISGVFLSRLSEYISKFFQPTGGITAERR